MAITENEMLHLKKGEHSYLLLKSPGRFHMIHKDAALTEANFDRLLRVYPCDDAQLKKLGLHFSVFKPKSLESIVTRGCKTENMLELWFSNKCRIYQFEADYSDDYLTEFFASCQLTKLPPQKGTTFNKTQIRGITWVITGISIVFSLLFCLLRRPYQLWSSLCLLCLTFVIALPLLYPAFFTLSDKSKDGYFRRGDAHKHKGDLSFASLCIGLALFIRTVNDFSFADYRILYIALAILTASIVLLGLYAWYNKGLRNGLRNALGVIFCVFVFSFGGIGQLNYLLDFHPAQSYVAEVSDQYIERRSKSSSFYCIVSQPDGEPLELNLTRRIYYDIDVGDELTVIYHNGAFGIPFYTTSLHTGDQAEVH